MDTITCSLRAYAVDWDVTGAEFGLAQYSEQKDVGEIVVCIRQLLDRADPPGNY